MKHETWSKRTNRIIILLPGRADLIFLIKGIKYSYWLGSFWQTLTSGGRKEVAYIMFEGWDLYVFREEERIISMSSTVQEWKTSLVGSEAPCLNCHLIIHRQERDVALVLRGDQPLGHVHNRCVAKLRARGPSGLSFNPLVAVDYPLRRIPEPEELVEV